MQRQADFTYDAFDRLVKRVTDLDGAGVGAATTEYFAYDGHDVALTFDASGNLTKRYLNGPAADQVLAEEQLSSGVTVTHADRTYWALSDYAGTVRDIYNSAGALKNHLTYDAFGNVKTETASSIDFLYGFQGLLRDEATGLYLSQTRWLDPLTGKWLQEDWISFAGGDANLARFVENSPTNYVDPSGMMWNLLKWIYTGDGYASDEVYDAATEAAGQSYSENAGLAHEALGEIAKADPTGLAGATDGVLTELEGEELHKFVMEGGLPRNGGPRDEAPLQDECRAFMEDMRDNGPIFIEAGKVIDDLAEAEQEGMLGPWGVDDGGGELPAPNPGLGGDDDAMVAGGGNPGGMQNGAGGNGGGMAAAPAGGNAPQRPGNGQGGEEAAAAAGLGGVLAQPPEEEGLKPYDVDTWENLKNKEFDGDGLDKDHIPSDAANRKRFELEEGRKPVPSEEKELYKNGTAVAVPHDKHAGSPTYKGRNNADQVLCDACDPVAAAQRDTDRMVELADEKHKETARKAQDEILKRADWTKREHEKRMREKRRLR